jgi:hypothetical protein
MRTAVGILVFVASAVALAVLAGIAFYGLSGPIAFAVLGLSALCGGCAALQTNNQPGSDALVLKSWPVAVMVLVFSLAAMRAFFWVIYRDGDSWMVLSPYNLGDLALHISLIRYLASGVPFWPESLILANSPLVYPVGVDLFNSLTLLAGLPLERGLVWCGLAGSALTVWALLRWAGAFGLAAFLFTGGLTGFAIFSGGGWELQDFGQDAEWKNAFLTMFVTQRNFLYALPVGLVLLIHWRRMLRSEPAPLPLWVSVLFYATMPLFSVHAFLFLSVCLVGVFFGVKTNESRRELFTLGVVSLLPASFAVALVTGGFSTTGGIRWNPGWMQGEDGLMFWIWNFGLMIPAWSIAIWQIIRDRNRTGVALGIPASVLFLACTLVAFAPWAWDNTKIMIWCWLVILPFIWQYVCAPLPHFGRAAVLVGLFFTGAISLVAGLDGRHGYRLASRSELVDTAALIAHLPPETRFATAPDYAHPVLMSGRRVAIGYPGHLWSHGLDYHDDEAALNRLLMGAPTWRGDASSLGVSYIYWGLREGRRFSNSTMDWRTGDSDVNASGELIRLPSND